jgi:predicted nucleic acid-binding protein
MILVDSSIWVDHLRSRDSTLADLLAATRVFVHPFVIGELALDNLRQRETVLDALRGLPQATVARDHEVLDFIDRHSLAGLGIGYIDAHLLASTLLSSAILWTRDKRMAGAATRLSIAWQP